MQLVEYQLFYPPSLYQGWIDVSEPVVMWISGLHVPESYMTALVQKASRARSWALDKSVG